MEHLENSARPNGFRSLKMQRLEDELKGGVRTASRDGRQKLKESKKQLKVMIQQDRDRHSAALEDLTKNDSRVM